MSLPDEVWSHIASFLGPDLGALARLGAACRKTRSIVTLRSHLWPTILSNFLVGSKVVHHSTCFGVEVTFDRAQSVLVLSTAEAYNAAVKIRAILPPECYAAVVRRAAGYDAPLPGSFEEELETRTSSAFYRLASDYFSSRHHRNAMLSVPDDLVEYVFDLEPEEVRMLRNSSLTQSTLNAIPVATIVTAAADKLLAKEDATDVFSELFEQSSMRFCNLRERQLEFRIAAEARGLLLPSERVHVSVRMFSTGVWSMAYALKFLLMSQTKIVEEVREHRLQVALIGQTELCMSPYSSLSFCYISGDLSCDLEADDDTTLYHVVARLWELDFYCRFTPYVDLKRLVWSDIQNEARTADFVNDCAGPSVAESAAESRRFVDKVMLTRGLADVDFGNYKVRGSSPKDFISEDLSWYVYEEDAYNDAVSGAKPGRVLNCDDVRDECAVGAEIQSWSLLMLACRIATSAGLLNGESETAKSKGTSALLSANIPDDLRSRVCAILVNIERLIGHAPMDIEDATVRHRMLSGAIRSSKFRDLVCDDSWAPTARDAYEFLDIPKSACDWLIDCYGSQLGAQPTTCSAKRPRLGVSSQFTRADKSDSKRS